MLHRIYLLEARKLNFEFSPLSHLLSLSVLIYFRIVQFKYAVENPGNLATKRTVEIKLITVS